MTPADSFVEIHGARSIRSLLRLLARSALFTMLAAVGVHAQAAEICTVASGATLSFGTVVALASTGNVSANSGTSFWVNCHAATLPPTLHSASTRTLVSGAHALPFQLSVVSAGGTELPTTSPGTTLGIVRNGTNQTVPLYGRITPTDFKSLPSGFYSTSITLKVEY